MFSALKAAHFLQALHKLGDECKDDNEDDEQLAAYETVNASRIATLADLREIAAATLPPSVVAHILGQVGAQVFGRDAAAPFASCSDEQIQQVRREQIDLNLSQVFANRTNFAFRNTMLDSEN